MSVLGQVTDEHKVGDLTQVFPLTVPKARNPKSGRQQFVSLQETLEGVLPASSSFWWPQTLLVCVCPAPLAASKFTGPSWVRASSPDDRVSRPLMLSAKTLAK